MSTSVVERDGGEHTMVLRVFLPIITDSDNSYPDGSVEFTICADLVSLRISGTDRTVSVDADKFRKLARIL